MSHTASAPATAPATATATAPSSWWSRFTTVVRQIIGAPDYERYVAYQTKHHPECALLTRDAFFKERMNQKYTQPGSRCC